MLIRFAFIHIHAKKQKQISKTSLLKTTLQKLLDPAGLHCTTSERSGPSLHSMMHNFLSRPLSFLDWTYIMHNQTFTDDSECCSTIGLQRTQKGPCHTSLSPATGSRLQLESSSRYWCLHIEQPQAQHPPTSTTLMTIYIPSKGLRSASERCLVVPSQRGTKSLSRRFSFTIPGWWNELPTPIRNAESLTIFKRHLKTHIFRLHLTSAPSSSLSLPSPCLASFALNNAWNFVWQALPVTVCLFIMAWLRKWRFRKDIHIFYKHAGGWRGLCGTGRSCHSGCR